jgi:hypothetical protein
MSPVLGVLVAMALMAALGMTAAIGGVIVGAIAFAPPADAAGATGATAQAN